MFENWICYARNIKKSRRDVQKWKIYHVETFFSMLLLTLTHFLWPFDFSGKERKKLFGRWNSSEEDQENENSKKIFLSRIKKKIYLYII